MKECPDCKLCYEDSLTNCPVDGKPLFLSAVCSTVLSGRYVLERRLGKGGMGTVFKAKHKFLKTAYAVKIISPEVVKEDETLLIRFRQEAVLAASLSHPNIVSVTDFGDENNELLFLVMEFIEGISLEDLLRREKRLSPEKTFEILSQVAAGIGAAHQRGIAHRDLKPLNIMLKNGVPLSQAVKVLDFGLAKIKSTESYASLIQAQTKNFIGSPLYMSPEQWANEDVDTRTDIYSMGIILYQMLAGKVPFTGDSFANIMYKHLQSKPPSLASMGVTVSPRLEDFIQRVLSKKQNDRPQSVSEFLAEFEEAVFEGGARKSFSESGQNLLGRGSDDFEGNTHFDKSLNLSNLTLSQNETLATYLNRTLNNPNEKEELTQDFINAQSRVEEANSKLIESERLAREFAEVQKKAEEARRQSLQSRQEIESLSPEEQTAEDVKERAALLEKQALDSQREADEARLHYESEISKRKKAETAKLKAETEMLRLAQEIIDVQQRFVAAQELARSEAEKLNSQNAARRETGELVRDSAPLNLNFPDTDGKRFKIQIATQEGNASQTSEYQPAGTGEFSPKRKLNISAVAGVAALVLVAAGSFAVYQFGFTKTNENPAVSSNKPANQTVANPANLPERFIQKMSLIPGGSFQIGRNDVKPDEKSWGVQFPAHSVSVNDFYFDKTEVTNEEYAEFIKATGRKAPDNWTNNQFPAGQDKFPVANVSNSDARDFAEWISRRDNVRCQLPSEEEWEYAARSGNQQFIYPWGNEWSEGRANLATGNPVAVGTGGDKTAAGDIQDMLGNVMEWTSTTFTYYPNFPENYKDPTLSQNFFLTVRGLSFAASKEQVKRNNLLLTYRQGVPSDRKFPFLGFRLSCRPK